MKQTWRWFGPTDKITTSDMLQAGVEGIVTSLYHNSPGVPWEKEEIKTRQDEIGFFEDGSPTSLSWDVVESLPVSENIKTQTGNWLEDVEAYKQSLRNLSSCGLRTVCYNFMPVLDWTRTSLRTKMDHGGYAMRFDAMDFSVFDLFILQRKNAKSEYPSHVIAKAKLRFDNMTNDQCKQLAGNIVSGLPGANNKWTIEDVRDLLETYKTIDPKQLRKNMIAFLELVAPLAAELNINLCCHPDDPPFSILGLPRIISTVEDYRTIMQAVDIPQNGITLCTGSMGVNPGVDFSKFIETWGYRIHFAHLRNTRSQPFTDKIFSFVESPHLSGDTDMIAVINSLLVEEKRRRDAGHTDWEIPMRPDHGQELADDIGRGSLPGYPLIGRLRGLAELRGVMVALQRGL